MSKEMVISANRHETRVALIEDDQLVEVYFQRANEYSLAGSIHKGRVTRVLPGMQSAFVDLGLERDTFLYVSDFLEEHEDIDRVTDESARRANGIASAVHRKLHPSINPCINPCSKAARPRLRPWSRRRRQPKRRRLLPANSVLSNAVRIGASAADGAPAAPQSRARIPGIEVRGRGSSIASGDPSRARSGSGRGSESRREEYPFDSAWRIARKVQGNRGGGSARDAF